MSQYAATARHRPLPDGERLPPAVWRRPTFREFADRVEREFGVAAGSLGRSAQEKLTPADIRCLCQELGVPPEDLGV